MLNHARSAFIADDPISQFQEAIRRWMAILARSPPWSTGLARRTSASRVSPKVGGVAALARA